MDVVLRRACGRLARSLSKRRSSSAPLASPGAANGARAYSSNTKPCYDVLFCGSDYFSQLVLARLLQEQSLIRSLEVLTSSDVAERQTWGGSRMKHSPVKVLADKHGLKHRAVPARGRLAECLPDWASKSDSPMLVTASFGHFIPRSFLQPFTRLGAERALNVHPSLLPKLRGAAPVPWALASAFSPDADKKGTLGVTIQDLSTKGFDRGRILYQEALPATVQKARWQYEDALTLLAHGGGEALVRVLANLPALIERAGEQIEADATLAPKLKAHPHASIKWKSMTAQEIDARWRAFKSFFPLHFTVQQAASDSKGGTQLHVHDLDLVSASALGAAACKGPIKRGMHSAPATAAVLSRADIPPGTAVFCPEIPTVAAGGPTSAPGLIVKGAALSVSGNDQLLFVVIRETRLDGRKRRRVDEEWWNGYRQHADGAGLVRCT